MQEQICLNVNFIVVQKSSNHVRIGMINNPSEDPASENTVIARAIWVALQTQTSNIAKNFITKLAKEENAKELKAGAAITEFAVGVSVQCGFCHETNKPLIFSDYLLHSWFVCWDLTTAWVKLGP